MFPVAVTATTTAPAPTSLVATPLPENFAQRVPSTNVAPSVSSVQISNNARGNGSYIAIDQIAQYPVPVVEVEAATGATDSIASSKIPATFLAQIIGQDVPPSLQAQFSQVLTAYAEQLATSYTKYKPAQFPTAPRPADSFGRLLAQEHVQAEPARAETPQPVRVEQPVQQVQQRQEVPVEQIERAAAPEIKQAAPAEKPAPTPQPKRAGPTSVKVAIAYLLTEARVDLEAPPALNASA